MALAVTHVLLSAIAVDLYRDYVAKHKKYFTLHTVFLAGFGGLLPDIDIPIGWLFGLFGVTVEHGTVTHTPFFGLLVVLPGLWLWWKGHHVRAVYFFVMGFGVLLHVFLDLLVNEGGYALLWPVSGHLFSMTFWPRIGLPELAMGIDAVILLAWLYHEERKHKILDFI